MTETTAVLTASETITVIEGFDAMRIFLSTVWKRQGNPPKDIAFIIGGARWADGSPVDPTLWEDWLVAVRISRLATGDA